MVDAIGIALSGTTAETRRMEASASNIANLRSRGALPGSDATGPKPYEPLTTSQSDVRTADGGGSGTRAAYRPLNRPFVPEYDPGAAEADSQGMVGTPDVDVSQEMTQQILAKNAYKANLAVMKTSDEMTRSLLDATA
jgi:flagellar basal-body rod protein FlgC